MSYQNQPLTTNPNPMRLDFETVLTNSFATYRKIAVYAGLALLVFSFIFLFGVSALLAYFVGEEHLNEKAIQGYLIALQSKPYILYFKGYAILINALASLFIAGFYKMAQAAEQNNAFGLADLFSCFLPPFVGRIIGVSLLINVATNAISLGFEEIGLSFVGTLVVLPIIFLTMLSTPLIVLKNYDTLAAIKRSFTVVSQNPTVLFMLVAIGIVVTLLGLFLCIGIMFTFPFLIAILFTIVNHSEPKSVE